MREELVISIINRSNNSLPAYATEGASGLDLREFINEPIVLEPLQRALVPTGLFLELPQGYEAQIRPRSGLTIKQGITVLNTPGTIDADYRGEIKLILVNLSKDNATIHNGDRVAQMVVQKVEKIVVRQATVLTDPDRGAGGFGHTGKK